MSDQQQLPGTYPVSVEDVITAMASRIERLLAENSNLEVIRAHLERRVGELEGEVERLSHQLLEIPLPFDGAEELVS